MNGIKHINMDYKKAYKAVLETATQWIEDGCTDKEKICLESVFPELRESEDERNERIRKAIVHLLEVASEGYLIDATGFKKEQFLSYLEKQKKPENVSATTMAPSCWEVEQEEQKPPIAGNDFGWIDELKHDLEHPEELDQKVDDVLKQRKGIRALEWSEEDEKMINHIIEALPIWANEQITILPSQAEEYIKKLKSLRPSWKPSEEQMEALDKALYYVPEEIGIPIAEIYGHFNKMKKKLM